MVLSFACHVCRWDIVNSRRKYIGETNSKRQPNSQGTLTYPDGGNYTGAWKDGKWHCPGALTYVDGRAYTGDV